MLAGRRDFVGGGGQSMGMKQGDNKLVGECERGGAGPRAQMVEFTSGRSQDPPAKGAEEAGCW